MQYNTFTERFYDFEQAHDLYDLEIAGLAIWPMLRFQLHRALATKKGILETSHDSYGHGFLFFVKRLGRNIRRMVVRSFWRAKYEDIFIFGHPRRQCIDGVRMDIYTDLLKKKLQDASISYQDFEAVYRQDFSPLHEASSNILYLDMIEGCGRLLAKLFGKRLTPTERKSLQQLEQDIEETFAVCFDVIALVQKVMRQHSVYRWFFDKLLARCRPKIIIEVGGYGYLYQALNASAKKYNIPTIELQHGTLSRYHLGYTHSRTDITHDIFPDTLFTFGEFWHTQMQMPAQVDLVAMGYPFFEFQQNNYADTTKDPYAIIVISQGVIGKKLYNFILNLVDNIGDSYRIFYKLHPGEFKRAKKDYPLLYEKHNIIVITNEQTVYDLFQYCAIQIGVGSTALYEGIGYGLSTILLNMPGIEYMSTVIEKGVVHIVDTVGECNKLLCMKNKKVAASSVFFKKDSLDNTLNNLTGIMATK